MPKVEGTRKEGARTLLERILRGPSFNIETTDEATRHYQIWVESWVVDELIDLVPELRNPLGGVPGRGGKLIQKLGN